MYKQVLISIHAPTRGATMSRVKAISGATGISIHAPTRGATGFGGIRSSDYKDFNPRSHKGSDAFPPLQSSVRYPISIHAPTRGATKSFVSPKSKSNNFNPRSHKGSDFVKAKKVYSALISIHAPTRGATAIFPNFRPCITLNIPKFYQYHSFFLIICS